MSALQYKALILNGPGKLELVTRETEPLKPGQVRVRMAAVGICGSDMHYYKHFGNVGFPLLRPIVLGHEASGVVVEVDGEVCEIKPGDKVVVNPLGNCGVCSACLRGELSLCERSRFPGSALTVPHIDGFFREYFETDASCCIRLPEDTDLARIALADPLACALHALDRAGSCLGGNVLITGTGTVGVMTAAAARFAGAARVVVAGRTPAALAMAKRMGADELVDTGAGGKLADHGPFDIVVESTGVPAYIADGLSVLRKGGTLVQLGSPPAGMTPVPWSYFMEREIRAVGAMRWNDEFATAVKLILSNRIDPMPVLSRQFPLDAGGEAFAAAADHSVNMKIQFRAGD